MYTLIMVLLIGSNNSGTGGPLIVDGFKTKDACYAHADKIKRSIPARIIRNSGIVDTSSKVVWEHVDCIEKKID